MIDLSSFNNIQLEIELVKEKKIQKNFETLYHKIQKICEKECDISVEDLLEHLKYSSTKVAALKIESSLRKKSKV